MSFVICILIGALAGELATWVCRSQVCRSVLNFQATTSIAVGILGALLGLASDAWVATGELMQLPFNDALASSLGALAALFLWILAQRLFLSNDVADSVTGD